MLQKQIDVTLERLAIPTSAPVRALMLIAKLSPVRELLTKKGIDGMEIPQKQEILGRL